MHIELTDGINILELSSNGSSVKPMISILIGDEKIEVSGSELYSAVKALCE